MGTLVWFRSDLRVEDNPALHAASQRSPGRVTGLFIATPRQWERHDWGEPKRDFVRRSVAALADELAGRGITLRVEVCPTFAQVPETLVEIARQTDSRAVYFNRELEWNERQRDAAVVRKLDRMEIESAAFDDQTLIPPGEIETSTGKPYSVFTPFFRNWSRRLEDSGLDLPLPAPEAGDAVEVPPMENWPDSRDWPAHRLWPAGPHEATRRLESFLDDAARRYHEDRDLPHRAATSTLSPYLAVGAISARSVLWQAVRANGGELIQGQPGITLWLRQLAWRDFYRHVLVGFPRVSKYRAFREETETIEWNDDPEALEAWKSGRTGFPIVDASMRCLAETGWLHNRLRMIAASFLTKDLLLDWRQGEEHFMRSLVDADLANNNGGWQWAASTGTDAVPYFRVFNPWTQSKRFDPKAQFIRRFVPELDELPNGAHHDPKHLATDRPATYPAPLVDHQAARRRAIAAFRDR